MTDAQLFWWCAGVVFGAILRVILLILVVAGIGALFIGVVSGVEHLISKRR